MKHLILCVSLFLSVNALAQDVDTMSTIIRYNGGDRFYENNDIFPEHPRAATLNAKELSDAETLLKKCVDEYNKKQDVETKLANKENPGLQQEKTTIYLHEYRKQYVPVVDYKNEKIVFVNCLCYPLDENWKKELEVMHDAGKCYFSLMVNLTTHNYYNFFIEENH